MTGHTKSFRLTKHLILDFKDACPDRRFELIAKDARQDIACQRDPDRLVRREIQKRDQHRADDSRRTHPCKSRALPCTDPRDKTDDKLKHDHSPSPEAVSLLPDTLCIPSHTIHM